MNAPLEGWLPSIDLHPQTFHSWPIQDIMRCRESLTVGLNFKRYADCRKQSFVAEQLGQKAHSACA
jgi:hypothetical protein